VQRYLRDTKQQREWYGRGSDDGAWQTNTWRIAARKRVQGSGLPGEGQRQPFLHSLLRSEIRLDWRLNGIFTAKRGRWQAAQRAGSHLGIITNRSQELMHAVPLQPTLPR
jgi:hypothetical protein